MAWGVPKIGALVTVASGNVALTEPAGIAQGDLMVACIAYRSNVAFTLPSGWTLVATQQSTGDTDSTFGIASGVMAWIVRGASAPALTFNRTGGDLGMGRIIAYSGAHASPGDTGSANTLAVASATVTTASITTAVADELLVAMISTGDNLSATSFTAATDPTTASGAIDTTTAPTAGTWIERSDDGTNTGADGGLTIADAVKATAGATGEFSATVSNVANHVMIVAAFKPPVESIGAATGASTVTGRAGSVGEAAGASSVLGDFGSVGQATGASAAAGEAGSVGEATGASAAAGESGSVGDTTGASSVSGIAGGVSAARLYWSRLQGSTAAAGSVGAATGAATCGGLAGSVAAAAGAAAVNGQSDVGSVAAATGAAAALALSGSVANTTGAASAAAIAPDLVVHPATTYQTMDGWESTYAGTFLDASSLYDPNWETKSHEVIRRVIYEMGINAIQLSIRSGWLSDSDFWTDFVNGVITYEDWRASRYETIEPGGTYYYSEFDWQCDYVLRPFLDIMAERGETPRVGLVFIDFVQAYPIGYDLSTDTALYAQIVKTFHDRMVSRMGVTPDAIDILLEPENCGVWNNGTRIGNAIVSLRAQLPNIEITAPSPTNASNTVTLSNAIVAVTGAQAALDRVGYHRYDNPNNTTIGNIKTWADARSKKTGMTEWFNATIDTVFSDLTVGGASLWQKWALVSRTSGASPSTYYWWDNNSANLQIATNSQHMALFFPFVRRSAVRIGAASSSMTLITAFENANGNQVVFVKRTTASSGITISGLDPGSYGVRHIPNASTTAQNNADVVVDASGNTTVTIPAGYTVIYKRDARAYVAGSAEAIALTVSVGGVTCGATVSGLAGSVGAATGAAAVAGYSGNEAIGAANGAATASGLAGAIGRVTGTAAVTGYSGNESIAAATGATTVAGLAGAVGQVTGAATVSGLVGAAAQATGAAAVAGFAGAVGVVSGTVTVAGLAGVVGQVSGAAAVSGLSSTSSLAEVTGSATAYGLAGSVGVAAGSVAVAGYSGASSLAEATGTAVAAGISGAVGSVAASAAAAGVAGSVGRATAAAAGAGLAGSVGVAAGVVTAGVTAGSVGQVSGATAVVGFSDTAASTGAATGAAVVVGRSGAIAAAAGAAAVTGYSGSSAGDGVVTGSAVVNGMAGAIGAVVGSVSARGLSGAVGLVVATVTVVGLRGSVGAALGDDDVRAISGSVGVASGSATVNGIAPSTTTTNFGPIAAIPGSNINYTANIAGDSINYTANNPFG